MICAHCSLPLGRHVVDDQFCCASCSTVHKLLHEVGVAEEFYKLRSIGGSSPVAATAGPSVAVVSELNSPVFLERNTFLNDDGTRRTSLYLDGVHCAACVWLVEGMAGRLPGVASSRLDLARSRLDISWNPAVISLGAIADWLGNFGYTPHPSGDTENSPAVQEEKRLLWRVGLAWALAANVMILAISSYAGLGASAGATGQLLHAAAGWASLLLTIPALAVAGRVFFERALESIRRAFASRSTRHLDMDTPVAIGLAVGFADSAVSTFTGSGDTWFDSLTLLVAALLTARWLQLRSRRIAAEAADRLVTVLPTLALVKKGNGETVDRTTKDLKIGDRVIVQPGCLFPADGVVLEGRSVVDRSAMTGESAPEPVHRGSAILAGTLNVSTRVVCEVSVGGESSKVARLLSSTQADPTPAPIVDLADRLSGHFVASVLTLAAITLAIWMVLDPGRAVSHTVALLVITCPCALGMATPLALAVASGKAARQGIFIKSDAAVQALDGIDLVALDKTGTITQGQPRLIDHFGARGVIRLAAALERGLNHPVAKALVAASDRTDVHATSVEYTPGQGVLGIVNGQSVRVGKPEWASLGCSDALEILGHARKFPERGRTPIVISVDGRVAAALSFGDAIREEAAEFVARLHRRGLQVYVLSGDHTEVAVSVAAAVNISPDRVFGDVSPRGKRAMITRWQKQGLSVAMIGDGLNDAPALRRADVGIAIDSGQQVNRFAADIVTSRFGLSAVWMLVDGARQTMRTIRRNLFVSLGYNILVASMAMAGFVTPLVAAIAMPISSLFVVGSSLRLGVFAQGESKQSQRDSKVEPNRPLVPQPAL